MTKYLWLIRLEPISSAVVVAETPTEAKCMLPTRAIGNQATWCNPDFVQVECLGVAEPGLEGIICMSHTIQRRLSNE